MGLLRRCAVALALGAACSLGLAAPAWAAGPVLVTVHGAGMPPDEALLVHFVGPDGESGTAKTTDDGRGVDEVEGDNVWTGEVELGGDEFSTTFEAGTRTFPKGKVAWTPATGARWVKFMIRGAEVDVTVGRTHSAARVRRTATREEQWGIGAFFLVSALVGAIAVASRWGRGARPVGVSRVPTPMPLGGERLPRGRVRVAEAAIAEALVAELATAYTVLLVDGPEVRVAAGCVLRLRRSEPERLAGAVKACGEGAVAVVVAAPADEADDWVEVAAELPPEVPVFVLVPAGEAAPELVLQEGAPRWAPA